MAITHVASVSDATTDTHAITTAAIDTSGADFIVIAVASGNPGVGISAPTDSKSNVWTALTQYPATQGYSEPVMRLYYSTTGNVGSGHTFTAPGTSNSPAIAVSAFAGVDATPFDQEVGWTGFPLDVAGTADSALTPAADNYLFISAVTVDGGNTIDTINSSFTISANTPPRVTHPGSPGIAIARQIQTTATARNPQWAFAGNNYYSIVNATFQEAAGGGGGTTYSRFTLLGVG